MKKNLKVLITLVISFIIASIAVYKVAVMKEDKALWDDFLNQKE